MALLMNCSLISDASIEAWKAPLTLPASLSARTQLRCPLLFSCLPSGGASFNRAAAARQNKYPIKYFLSELKLQYIFVVVSDGAIL